MSSKIIDQVANYNILKTAWNRVYLGKTDDVRERSKGVDEISLLDYQKAYSVNLKKLSDLLVNNKYEMQPLKGFLEKKKSGKFRLIGVPTVEDRIVHTAILIVIEGFFLKLEMVRVIVCQKLKIKKKKLILLMHLGQ